MANVLNRDPTRTTTLRKKFMGDMNRRFKKVAKATRELIVTDDVFGLKPPVPLSFNVEAQAWRFRTDPDKLTSFNNWFKEQIDQDILTVTGPKAQPWTSPYVESAYKKGVERAYDDTHAAALAENVDFYEGSKQQFLNDAFRAPETVSKLRLLQLRTFEELRGVTAHMSQQMSRILAQGLADGSGPAKIAREMTKSIEKITRTRALVIARTEIIHAHAEGQLDSMERLGIEKVEADVEWATAGDDRVCVRCQDLEGTIFTIDEARGMIPLHPNCRCAWIPSLRDKKKKAQPVEKKAEEKIPAKSLPFVDIKGKQTTWSSKNMTLDTLSSTERASLREYQRGLYNSEVGGYTSIQNYLRFNQTKTYGHQWTKAELNKYVGGIDDALKKSVLNKNVNLYRGVTEYQDYTGLKNLSDLKKGYRFTDKGYSSTTTSKSITKKFSTEVGNKNPAVFIIKTPAGTQAYPMDLISASGEREMLLPRGLTFEVLQVKTFKGVPQITVEIVGL